MSFYRVSRPILIWLLFSILCSILCAPAYARGFLTQAENDWLKTNGETIDILFGYEAPPNAFHDAQGHYAGLLVDFAKEIEDILGVSFRMRKLDTWNELINYSQTGRNFVIVGIAPSASRAKFLSFTNAFIKVPYIIVTRNSSSVASIKDLHGTKVCTVANYAINDYLAEHYPAIWPTGVKDNLEGLRGVSTGEFNAMILNQMYASYLIHSQGLSNLKIVAESGYINPLTAAASVHDRMLFSILDKAVDQITPKRREELYRHWVGGARTGVSRTTVLWVCAGLALLFILLAASWAWVRALRTVVLQQTAKLSESEERYRLLVEASIEGIWSMDATHRVTFVNPAMTNMLGYTAEEMLARNVEEFFFEEDLPHHALRMDVRHAGGDEVYERRFKRKDGSEIWVLISAKALQDKKGNFAGSLAMLTDLSERKRAEEALKKSEQHLRKVVTKTPHPLCIVNNDTGKVEYCNEAFVQTFGYSHKDVATLEQWWKTAFVDPDYRSKIQDAWQHAVSIVEQTGESVGPQEWSMRRKDTAQRDVEFSIIPLENTLLIAMTDLTPQKEMLRSLRNEKERAEDASKSKSAFLANMSHELRTPLNGVMGMLQLLGATSQNSEQTEFTQVAVQSCKRLDRLLGDILDMARIEAGRMKILHEPFDVSDTLKTVEQIFYPAASQMDVDLSITIDDDVPARLTGDAARLQQILNNLVGNALKFTSKGSVTVNVGTLSPLASGRPRLIFSVTDTGIGIPDDRIHELFEPFTQVEGQYKRQFQGAGLGLSIVKQLISLMKGNACVVSEQGKGTTFYVVLPFTPDTQENSVVPEPLPQRSVSPENCTVLLAEDDEMNRTVIFNLLKAKGITSILANDGLEVLNVLQKQHIDLILMDIQMPVMDGMEATTRIRNGEAGEHNKDIPIIAVTAYAMAGDKEKFLNAGIDGYLAKPIELQILYDMMLTLLASKARPQ